jgi:hypothetical protein
MRGRSITGEPIANANRLIEITQSI